MLVELKNAYRRPLYDDQVNSIAKIIMLRNKTNVVPVVSKPANRRN